MGALVRRAPRALPVAPAVAAAGLRQACVLRLRPGAALPRRRRTGRAGAPRDRVERRRAGVVRALRDRALRRARARAVLARRPPPRPPSPPSPPGPPPREPPPPAPP